MNHNMRDLLARAIGAIENPGDLMGDDARNLVEDLQEAIDASGDPSSIIYPVDVLVIGMSEVALFLGAPIDVLVEAANDSKYTYGTNDRTLVTRDNFRDDILEMALDDSVAGSQQIIDRFNKSVSEDTFIDLEA